MPIAAVINGAPALCTATTYTPRCLTHESGQVAWQWRYSAFGEDKPLARYRFANTETTPNPGTTNIAEVKPQPAVSGAVCG